MPQPLRWTVQHTIFQLLDEPVPALADLPARRRDLVVSPSTVHTHPVHIYTKCGVSTRAGLAMFAMRHGLAARTGPAAAAKID